MSTQSSQLLLVFCGLFHLSLIYGKQVYDYCSMSHSSYVLERVDSEVLPIFSRYNVELRKSCPFSSPSLQNIRNHLNTFNQRKNQGSKVECPKCKKQFKNLDYLEFHYKTQHISDNTGINYDKDNTNLNIEYDVCLSDYCDIFECREHSDKILKFQVFMNRQENYEGIFKRQKKGEEDPYRYYLMQTLPLEQREKLEQQCLNLFLNCIDFDITTAQDSSLAFDLLYTIYCKKFVTIDRQQEIDNEESNRGVNQLIMDVQAESPAITKKSKNQDVMNVLKIIFGVFAVILTVLYYTGIYFSIFDEEAIAEKQKNAAKHQVNYIKDKDGKLR